MKMNLSGKLGAEYIAILKIYKLKAASLRLELLWKDQVSFNLKMESDL
jgi:hypothetical protein